MNGSDEEVAIAEEPLAVAKEDGVASDSYDDASRSEASDTSKRSGGRSMKAFRKKMKSERRIFAPIDRRSDIVWQVRDALPVSNSASYNAQRFRHDAHTTLHALHP
jgi:hypothetical protein